jgi:hypothetical protein
MNTQTLMTLSALFVGLSGIALAFFFKRNCDWSGYKNEYPNYSLVTNTKRTMYEIWIFKLNGKK